jgi:LPXTG-motif cell wall-anchored protein
MKKTSLFLVIFASTAMLMAINVKAVNAISKITLSPASGSYNVGDTFKVTVGVDSGAEIVGGVDGVGTYDSSKLDLTIEKASDLVFNGNCSGITASAGKFGFSCYSNDSLTDTTVKGNLVVMTFKAKATGTAVVNFNCTDGSTTDSNIVKSATSTDVITCSSNDKGSYVIGSSSGETTSTPTNTPAPQTTSTAELPKTGGAGSTVGLVIFGAISVIGAFFLRFL